MKTDIQRINRQSLRAAAQQAHDRGIAAVCYMEAMAQGEPKATVAAFRKVLMACAIHVRAGMEPLKALLSE